MDGPMPIDPTLKRHMFETARGKAADLGHNYVGTEHLLLALVEDPRRSETCWLQSGWIQLMCAAALMELLPGQPKDP